MNSSHIGSPGAWAEAKVERATAHYSDLRSQIDAWFASNPYRVQTVIAEDRLSWRTFLRIDKPAPLVEWATSVGDCVHNLRSALDAAVWELSHADGAAPTHPRLVQFPFCDRRSDWNRRLKGSLAGLPADLLSKLEAVQPYNHNDDGERISALTLVNNLDIEDKHRAGITAQIRATHASSRSQIRFESDEAARRHVRPKQEIVLELVDGALLHAEQTNDPIVEVRGDFDATAVFTLETSRGPGTIWKVLDLAFEATIRTLEHLYADS